MNALFERIQATFAVEGDNTTYTGSSHDAHICNFVGGQPLMGMPECKIPFALTGKDISSKQQLLEPSFVFRSQLGVKSSDDLVYTQQLLRHTCGVRPIPLLRSFASPMTKDTGVQGQA